MVKSPRRRNAEPNKDRHHDQLSDKERRFRLRRRQRFQRRHLLEGLHDGDKDVEIKREDHADDVDPAPSAGEVVDVKPKHCDAQHQQGQNAEHM